MHATGVGLGGIDGVWWRAAAQPFVLNASAAEQLKAAADAFFALHDAVAIACDDDDAARAALTYKVPKIARRDFDTAPVLCLRPDFQVLISATGELSLRATEIETCPSAMGVAHAMQRGYQLAEDLADAYAALCAGRPFRMVVADAWREFAWDMLVLCRALRERGVDACVMFEQPLRIDPWSRTAFGMPSKPKRWDSDARTRLIRHDFQALVTRDAPPPDALIFRFGYVDTFSRRWQVRLRDWSLAGMAFVNPPSLIYDSKALLTLPALASVSAQLSIRQRATLGSALLETRLLTPYLRDQLLDEQHDWVLKFAGFDKHQRAWGGRSLQVGASLTRGAWARCVDAHLRLKLPCVAQRAAPSALLRAPLLGKGEFLGRSRVRAFFVRAGGRVHVCGVHLTLAGQDMAVSESVEALQAPVVFESLSSERCGNLSAGVR